MPRRELPENPDREHLRTQAKMLKRAVRAGEPPALALVAELHPGPVPEAPAFTRADALLVTARLYGFASWARLREHLGLVARYARSPASVEPAGEEVEARFLRLSCLRYGGDAPERRDRARSLLAENPGLATASIHTVAAVGDVAAARSLLAADPGLANRSGGPHDWEPVLYAAYSRVQIDRRDCSALEVARLLLAHGADPNAGYLWNGLYPFTALTGAFGEGEEGPVNQPRHPDCGPLARLLLDAGADPNDSQALYNRQFETDDDHLELLFAYGLGRGSGGPWHARFAANHPSPTELVRDQLTWAVEAGRTERVRLLLDHGAAADGGDASLVAAALRGGSMEIADLLVAAGAEPVVLDDESALRAALMFGEAAGVELLRRADPELPARLMATEPDLVLRAASLGRLDAVRLLVGLGFDLDARRRVTALHEAAGHGDAGMVELLLELGADPTILDTEHHATPLSWARHGNHRAVVEVLIRGSG